MRTFLSNQNAGPLPADRAAARSLPLIVTESITSSSATIRLDLAHERLADLRFWLVTPSGMRHPLTVRSGPSGQYDGELTIAVPADALVGDLVGRWSLRVEDVQRGDGGLVRGWKLELAGFRLRLVTTGLTSEQSEVFEGARRRVEGCLPGVLARPDWELVVDVSAARIDGAGGVLGRAGPTRVDRDWGLPLTGMMEFDSADLQEMLADGSLLYVVTHELFHICGAGTLWRWHDLIGADGGFVGPNALAAYRDLIGDSLATSVPVEDSGGPGTAGGHWKESMFGRELMSGWINRGINPLSVMTLESFRDMGWVVDVRKADAFALDMMGVGLRGDAPPHPCRWANRPPIIEV